MAHNLSALLVLVVALGIAAQWLGWRYRAPAIVLFAVAGLLAGPVLGLVNPSRDFYPLFQPVIGLSVAVILFEGGLNLHLHELREAAAGVLRLVFLGVPLAWGLGSAAAHFAGGLSWPVSLVFGAIMVVTGPTVITPLLRHASLNRRSASYLKWEAIINDPIGAVLATVVFEYLIFSVGGQNASVEQAFLSLGLAAIVALVVGGGLGYALGEAFRRDFVPEFLKAPMTLTLVLVGYVVCNQAQQEAGLLAVTIMGLVMGNMELPSLDEMRRFKEYVSILLVSTLFVMLAADLRLSTLEKLNWHSLALILAMIVLVRPLVVLLATLGSTVRWSDRLLTASVAPRGIVAAAVAGIFGPVMYAHGYTDARLLVPLVFAVVFATVVVHGFSIGWLARRLGLSINPHGVLIVGASPWATELVRALANELKLGVLLVDSSWHRLREARLAGLPVWYGEVLSDNMQESLELNEISCVLAATSNDAYNALVCHRLTSDLGHGQVFQLPIYEGEEDSKALARKTRGALAFGDNARYEELWRRHFQGWKFYKTRLTEGYTYEDFLRDCPDEMILIGVAREDGSLQFHAPTAPVKPKTGEIILYYASGRTAESTAIKKKARAEDRERAKQRAREKGKEKTDAGQR